MPQLTPGQARLIDPVLTSVAQGIKQQNLVASFLFPRVPVTQRGGKIITFGREDFMLYATGRAPGQNTKRVQFGYSGGPYALEDHSLEGVAPIENMQEASAVPGINLETTTITKTKSIIDLRLEKASADLARTYASYSASNKTALTSTARWSDFSGTSDPINDVETAKEAIRSKIGQRPNTIVMGAAVLKALRQHPKIVDRIKYTGRDVATPELLASLFGVDRVVSGEAVYADDAGNLADVWGKDVIIAYTIPAAMAEQGAPTYGYTYGLEGFPLAETPYFDRNAKSWIYPYTDVVAPVIAGIDAGYIIQTAVA